MNHTNEQLKRTLAKMLPDAKYMKDTDELFVFLSPVSTSYNQILDTELLHLCWLVEETLSVRQLKEFHDLLVEDGCGHGSDCPTYLVTHATWQQRTIALAKVKGIEIV